MKKLIAGCVIAGGLAVYLLIQNSHLKNENQILKQENETIETDTEELVFHEEAKTSAQAFIQGYFDYQDKPIREEVERYATEQALNQLQFTSHEELEGGEDLHVSSSVEDLAIYYGQSLDDRQELLILFDNHISFDGIDSQAHTLMKVDMIKDEEDWKVNEFTFTQY